MLKLEAHENMIQGMDRISREFFERTQHTLQSPDIPRDIQIHEIRLLLKRLRAIFRLARPVMQSDICKNQDKILRKSGQMLSDLRDQTVMQNTIDKLLEEVLPEGNYPELQILRSEIERSRPVDTKEFNQQLKSIEGTILNATLELTKLPWQTTKWEAFSPGINVSYQKARKAFRKAEKHPSEEHMHAWRKRIKTLAYQIDILGNSHVSEMKPLKKKYKKLAQMIGEYHDLRLLRSFLKKFHHPEISPHATKKLLQLLKREAKNKKYLALNSAKKLFQMKSSVWIKNLENYWQSSEPGILVSIH